MQFKKDIELFISNGFFIKNNNFLEERYDLGVDPKEFIFCLVELMIEKTLFDRNQSLNN